MLQSDKDLSVTTLPIHPCLDEWRERVIFAGWNGGFSEREIKLAEGWDTCAVGESHKKYPQFVRYTTCSKIKTPLDPILNRLGYSFYVYVSENDYKNCHETLDRIEARLNEMLMEAK